jgi:hypothetical protein
MIDLLALLRGVRRSGDGWTAHCPVHNDRQNSLSIHHRDGRWLLKCHAGCEWQAIVAALGMVAADLFDDEEGEGGGAPLPATAQPNAGSSRKLDASQVPEVQAPTEAGETGLTLDRYATSKGLPIDFLKNCGLSEFTLDRKPAVRSLISERLAKSSRCGSELRSTVTAFAGNRGPSLASMASIVFPR